MLKRYNSEKCCSQVAEREWLKGAPASSTSKGKVQTAEAAAQKQTQARASNRYVAGVALRSALTTLERRLNAAHRARMAHEEASVQVRCLSCILGAVVVSSCCVLCPAVASNTFTGAQLCLHGMLLHAVQGATAAANGISSCLWR